MAFLQLNTFLRSAIADDPFCLGDIGPEDVLRMESEFPELFGEVENTVSEIKKEEAKPKNTTPRKHDCLSKTTIPSKPIASRGRANLVMQRNVNKTPQVATSGRKLQGRISETEARRNPVSTVNKSSQLSGSQLKSTLVDILRRFEQDFPQERSKDLRARASGANSIGNKTVKHKSNVQLLHIKKVEKGKPEIGRKNPSSDVQLSSYSLPNVISGKTKTDSNQKTRKGNLTSKNNDGKTIVGRSRGWDNSFSHERDAPAPQKPNSIPASRTNATETKSAPGFLRNAIFNLPKPKTKKGSLKKSSPPVSQRKPSPSRIARKESKDSVESRSTVPQRKVDSKTTKDFNLIPTEKKKLPECLSESESLSESLLENNPLKEKETTVNGQSTSQIHIRKPIADTKDEIRVPEKIPTESVTRFEQLLLARTLASQYERQGRFHKHHTFTSPKKVTAKEELPATDPLRNMLSPNFLRDFQANTPGCKEVLEKIAEELIYVEVLKYLDTEQQTKPSAKQRSTTTEKKSAAQPKKIESKPIEKEVEEENQCKSDISSGRSNAGLSTINEESERELVTPDLTPPQSLVQSASKENEGDKSSFLSPVSSEDESTVLETPELTPIANDSTASKSSTLGKVSKAKKSNPQYHATNETTDCSELSDFLFTEPKIDSEIKSKSSEKLVTPILSVEQRSESIAEKELPNDTSSPSQQSREIEMETPKSSIHDDISQEEKRTSKSSQTEKECEDAEEQGESDINNKGNNVTFKSPPVVEFLLPKKKSSTKIFEKKSQSLPSSRTSKRSESSFGRVLMSETGVSGSIASVSYTGKSETSVTENLSEGELVGKRYQSPGELSASCYLSPGICPFSYPEVSSSDESEDGYALSEGAATTELSLGEVVASPTSSNL